MGIWNHELAADVISSGGDGGTDKGTKGAGWQWRIRTVRRRGNGRGGGGRARADRDRGKGEGAMIVSMAGTQRTSSHC